MIAHRFLCMLLWTMGPALNIRDSYQNTRRRVCGFRLQAQPSVSSVVHWNGCARFLQREIVWGFLAEIKYFLNSTRNHQLLDNFRLRCTNWSSLLLNSRVWYAKGFQSAFQLRKTRQKPTRVDPVLGEFQPGSLTEIDCVERRRFTNCSGLCGSSVLFNSTI